MAVRFSQRCRVVSRRWRWWSRRQSLPRPSRPSACAGRNNTHRRLRVRGRLRLAGGGCLGHGDHRGLRHGRKEEEEEPPSGGGAPLSSSPRAALAALSARRRGARRAEGGEARGGEAGAPAGRAGVRRPVRPALAPRRGARGRRWVEVDFSWFGLGNLWRGPNQEKSESSMNGALNSRRDAEENSASTCGTFDTSWRSIQLHFCGGWNFSGWWRFSSSCTLGRWFARGRIPNSLGAWVLGTRWWWNPERERAPSPCAWGRGRAGGRACMTTSKL